MTTKTEQLLFKTITPTAINSNKSASIHLVFTIAQYHQFRMKINKNTRMTYSSNSRLIQQGRSNRIRPRQIITILTKIERLL